MSADLTWGKMVTLASGLTLAADATNYHSLDALSLDADVVQLQVDVTFGATPDDGVMCTARASVDAGEHPDVGTYVAEFEVVHGTNATRRRTYLLSSPYPYYRVEIFNDDSADAVTYTLRALLGSYKHETRGVALTELQQRVNAAR